jgi:hypothetical protein
LLANSTQPHTFTQTYTIPKEEYYTVVVRAILACDVDISDNSDRMMECVDLDDIEVFELITPSGNIDIVGSAITLEIRLVNNSLGKTFPKVDVNAQIIGDGFNTPVAGGSVTYFKWGDTVIHKFTSLYAVPAVEKYTIKVYIDRVDLYPSNDTITEERNTDYEGGIAKISGTGLSLGQNIPNPAKENTRIDYIVPTDGEVLFAVYSITGQTLYSETVTSVAGEHRWEFNTSHLAIGIYYYSMTFNGEKLVKKMTIQR